MPRRSESLALKKYNAKRRFGVTPEPRGLPKKLKAKLPIFVIQKHAARRLHYDFRLEVSGVLKSWAVPKGLTNDTSARHLAVETEDHPMDYADFEGDIPKGEYGGGHVDIWDRGYFLNISFRNGKLVPMEEAVRKGHLTVWLEGRRHKGGWSLTRMSPADEEKRDWLMVKTKDVHAKKSPARVGRADARDAHR